MKIQHFVQVELGILFPRKIETDIEEIGMLEASIYLTPCLIKIQSFGSETGVTSPRFRIGQWHIEVVYYPNQYAPPPLHTHTQSYGQKPKEYRALHLELVWLQELVEVYQCWQQTTFGSSFKIFCLDLKSRFSLLLMNCLLRLTSSI